VYDISSFIDEVCFTLFLILLHTNIGLGKHPGGDEVVLAEAGMLPHQSTSARVLTSHHFLGTDATEAFEDIGHSDEARALLPGLLVGDLEENGVRTSILPLYDTFSLSNS
jgi:hypothetical protein